MTKGVKAMNRMFRNLKIDAIPTLPNPHFEPLIELISNREAVAEGCCGILEYNDCCIQINCKTYIISFKGFNLTLTALTNDTVSVKGKITDVIFSER